MATVKQLDVKLGVDAREFERKLNQAKQTVANVGKGLANIGRAAGVAGAGFAALAAKSISAANEQEQAERKLALALKNTGQLTEENLRTLLESASALQDVSTAGDEATIQLQALAVTMGASAEQADEMARAATDFAAATGIDANQAVRGLSQTLGGQVGILGRYIPQLRELTAEQLKNGAAIDLLAKNYAGFAQNEAQTFAGVMTQLGNVIGDQFEAIGFALTESGPFQVFVDQKAGVIDAIEDIGAFWARAAREISEIGGQVAAFVGQSFTKLAGTAIKAFANIKQKWFEFAGLFSSEYEKRAADIAAENERLFASIDKEVQKSGDFWEGIALQIDKAGDAIGTVESGTRSAAAAASKLSDAFAGAGESMQQAFSAPTAQASTGPARQTIQVAPGEMTSREIRALIVSLESGNEDVREQIETLSAEQATRQDALLQNLGGVFVGSLQQAQRGASTDLGISTISGIGTAVASFVNPAIGQVVGQLAGPLLDAMVNSPDKIGGFIADTVESLIDVIVAVIGNLGTIVSSIVDKLDEVILSIVGSLDEILAGLFRSIPQIFKALQIDMPIAFAKALAQTLKDLFKGVKGVFQKIGDGIKKIFGRADGGPFPANRNFLVGERGPEIVSFRKPGVVIPNESIGSGGGMMVTINIDGARSPQLVAQEVKSALILLDKQGQLVNNPVTGKARTR